jgi:hypothetical protein
MSVPEQQQQQQQQKDSKCGEEQHHLTIADGNIEGNSHCGKQFFQNSIRQSSNCNPGYLSQKHENLFSHKTYAGMSIMAL